MPQRNNHARSRQKRKKLRLKNLHSRIVINRAEKMIEANKSASIPGSVLIAVQIKKNRRLFDVMNHQKRSGIYIGKPNQRQRRKYARQQPHGKTFK